MSTAKKSKTTTFSRVFHPKKNRKFSPEIKVEFLDKKGTFRTVWSNNVGTRLFTYLASKTINLLVLFLYMILYPHSRHRIASRGLISFSEWHSPQM